MPRQSVNQHVLNFSAKRGAYPTGQAELDKYAISFLQHGAQAVVSVKFENDGVSEVDPLRGVTPAVSLVVKLSDSADGVTWADVAGSEKTVVPRGEQNFNGLVRKYWRILGKGGVQGRAIISHDGSHDIVKI